MLTLAVNVTLCLHWWIVGFSCNHVLINTGSSCNFLLMLVVCVVLSACVDDSSIAHVTHLVYVGGPLTV